jgi:hypothetical protein
MIVANSTNLARSGEQEWMEMGVHRPVALLFSLSLIWLPASTPTANAQRLAYFKADAGRLCAGVRPGGGELAKCLKEHEKRSEHRVRKRAEENKVGDGEVKRPDWGTKGNCVCLRVTLSPAGRPIDSIVVKPPVFP